MKALKAIIIILGIPPLIGWTIISWDIFIQVIKEVYQNFKNRRMLKRQYRIKSNGEAPNK